MREEDELKFLLELESMQTLGSNAIYYVDDELYYFYDLQLNDDYKHLEQEFVNRWSGIPETEAKKILNRFYTAYPIVLMEDVSINDYLKELKIESV